MEFGKGYKALKKILEKSSGRGKTLLAELAESGAGAGKSYADAAKGIPDILKGNRKFGSIGRAADAANDSFGKPTLEGFKSAGRAIKKAPIEASILGIGGAGAIGGAGYGVKKLMDSDMAKDHGKYLDEQDDRVKKMLRHYKKG